MDIIYTITTLHFRDQKYGKSPRLVAWYPDLATARECILGNWGDIYETSYRYAVIEDVAYGLYPHITEEHWFEWLGDHTGGYQPCEKPKEAEGICNFSIG